MNDIRTEADTDNLEYIEYLDILRTFRKTNPDIAYLYLMHREGDKINFVV